MNTRHIKMLAAFALLVSSLCAEQIKISRAAASELYVALASTEAGLTPSNSVTVSDNINALRPVVEALDKARASRDRGVRNLLTLAKKSPEEAQERAEKLQDEYDTKADELVPVELKSVALSDDEIRDCKLKPVHHATIRRWLLKMAKP